MSHTLPEVIQNHLPPYLSPQQKGDLFEQIKNFPNINYYIHKNDNEMLQGDGWTGFAILDFESGEKKDIKGIIISNSCDIDLVNDRDLSVNIVFAPLIKLKNYVNMIRAAGLSGQQLNSKIEAIQQQKITSIVYLPKGGSLEDDYIANLDDIHSMPLQFFVGNGRAKLFTLSQTAFYMFILKLSIHFCRFQENVLRYEGEH